MADVKSLLHSSEAEQNCWRIDITPDITDSLGLYKQMMTITDDSSFFMTVTGFKQSCVTDRSIFCSIAHVTWWITRRELLFSKRWVRAAVLLMSTVFHESCRSEHWPHRTVLHLSCSLDERELHLQTTDDSTQTHPARGFWCWVKIFVLLRSVLTDSFIKVQISNAIAQIIWDYVKMMKTWFRQSWLVHIIYNVTAEPLRSSRCQQVYFRRH